MPMPCPRNHEYTGYRATTSEDILDLLQHQGYVAKRIAAVEQTNNIRAQAGMR